MNAYVRELSFQLGLHRRKFVRSGNLRAYYIRLIREANPDLPPCVDVVTAAWHAYAGSDTFAYDLAECKAAAMRQVPWMTEKERNSPESAAITAAMSGGFAPADGRCLVPYDSDVVYKPFSPFLPYDHETEMEGYRRLGGRLARTHMDILPSEWIKSHARDSA